MGRGLGLGFGVWACVGAWGLVLWAWIGAWIAVLGMWIWLHVDFGAGGLGLGAWVGAWIGRLGLCWGMWIGLHGTLNIGPWTLDLGIFRNVDIALVL